MGLNHTYKLLHSKGNHKQNEKTTYRMAENICKWCDQQELNFQNIQTAHTTQQQENLIKKCAEELNRHLSKGHILMAKKHMKRISPLWIIRKMQMKSTMSYHFTPVRMAIIKITVAQRVWYWYFSWQFWFQLMRHPAQHFTWYTLHIS